MPYLLLERVRDGLIDRSEVFDLADEQLARRRFEELRHASATARRRCELLDRFAPLNEHDWDGCARSSAPDLSVRRPALGRLGRSRGRRRISGDRAAARSHSPTGRFDCRFRTSSSDRRCRLCRSLRWSRAPGGRRRRGRDRRSSTLGAARGARVTYFEIFEGDDAGSALERFEEIGAQTAPERVARTPLPAVRRARLGRARRLLTRATRVQSTTAASAGELRGPRAMPGLFRSAWIDVAPDVRLWFESLAVRREHYRRPVRRARPRCRWRRRDGVRRHRLLVRVRDGRIDRSELFDPADEQIARRRASRS